MSEHESESIHISNIREYLNGLRDSDHVLPSGLIDGLAYCLDRAKAWNELRKRLELFGGMWSSSGFIQHMDELVPPDPVDPLDELEWWARNIKPEIGHYALVHVEDLLAKILEFKEKR